MKKLGRALVVIIALLLVAIAGLFYYISLKPLQTTAYAAGNSNAVKIYRIAESTDGEERTDTPGGGQALEEAGTVIRGSMIRRYSKSIESEGHTYYLIDSPFEDTDADTSLEAANQDDELAEQEEGGSGFVDELKEDAKESLMPIISPDKEEQEAYYISEENISDTPDDVIRETEVYVRTPVTIYENDEDPSIASFAPKGTCLKVVGYDRLLDNGYVNRYKVQYDDDGSAGYVYGKYMTGTQEEADAVYNENGVYDAAKGDKYAYNLYGGKAKNLDFYPYERTQIEGNEFCTKARAMYLNSYAAVHPKAYTKIIKKTDCNAVVIDIKDGNLTYQSEVAKELSPTSYKYAYTTVEDMKESVDAYRETGVYLIGRIVVFNDPYYAKDHPKDCIKYNGSSSWPSAYSRNVWEYNVKLAQEAVREFGFNEIQFDYVRFPESSYEMSKSGKANFRNKYDEEKAQAIQNFCFYAADQLREADAYISIDVFGESAYSYVTAYGQYWMAISNIADAISAMPYTDHFAGEKPWEDPYASVKRWAKRAEKQQKRLENPAVARTWITGYDTPYWAPTEDYDYKKLKQQVNALEKCGLKGGFIPWNALSDTGKYNEYKKIWNEPEK